MPLARFMEAARSAGVFARDSEVSGGPRARVDLKHAVFPRKIWLEPTPAGTQAEFTVRGKPYWHRPAGERTLFVTTHWSVVLAAADTGTAGAAAALEQLCLTYWRPIYVYVRRRGYEPEDAQDLTQQFLAGFIQRGSFGQADPTRGRFRTFLLKSVQNFLNDEWKRTNRKKRGAGKPLISLDAQEAEERFYQGLAETMTPERAYERRWATTLLEQVLAGMRRDYEKTGRAPQFEALKEFLWGIEASTSYDELGAKLGLSEGAVRVAVHRFREQYRQRLRAQVAEVVGNPNEIDEEVRYLIDVVSQ